MKTVKIRCGKCNIVTDAEELVALAHYKCMKCDTVNNVTNIPLQEWIGFNYKEYLREIIKVITKDKFEDLVGETVADLDRGMLSTKQITQLKIVMKDNFKTGGSIKDMAEGIRQKVRVPDLEVRNSENETVYVISRDARAVNIARTESTRLANMGAEAHYEGKGVEKYEWVAALTDRTCETCMNLSGKIFEIGGGERPPAHALCRCTIIPVIKS